MVNLTNLELKFIEIQERQDWFALCNLLEDHFKINPQEANPLNIGLDTVTILGNLLSNMKNLLTEMDSSSLKVIKHIFKALRNSVAYNLNVQAFVIDSASILNDTLEILRYLKRQKDENSVACLKILLQFLINLGINNPAALTQIWYLFKDDLKELMHDNVCFYHTSALLYNIFLNDINLLEENCDIITSILDSYKQNNDNEYLTFLLELFVKNVHLNKTYISLKPEQRMLCLEMMKELLNKGESLMTEELVSIISSQFKKKSDCILKTVTNYLKEIEPFEVTLLLDLLAAVSSNELFSKHLQNDKSLLINCVFLLKSIHSVGKEAENNFTAIPKLSKLEESDTEVLQHPAYGFKASIIRLLANLCWKHKENQDEIRELDCIPLLLDCCNIDARNPFIIQWVIFAIRNLCENNIENQAVIAAMTKEGVVSSAALHEMGITLQTDEKHSIKIVPLDFNK